MATNDAGVYYPEGTDSFSPHTHIKGLADSLVDKVIVPVANATDRDDLESSAGPTTSTPLFVYQLDTEQLLVSTGTGFTVVNNHRPTWVALPLFAGVSGSVRLYREGFTVYLRGRATVSGSTTPGASRTICAAGTIPAGLRPDIDVDGICYQVVGGNSMPQHGLVVGSDGSIVATKYDHGDISGSAALRFAVTYVVPPA